MMKFKSVILGAVAAALLTASASAQVGQLGPGQFWGNPGAGQARSQPSNLTAIIDRAIGLTRGSMLERGASGWGIVPPSATSGLPWVGNGTGADPAYQLLTPVGGGTGNAFFSVSGPATSIKTYSFPNVNSTMAAVGSVQTWTGVQSFTDGTLILLGSSSGSSTIKAPATGGGTSTLFPGSDTIMGVAAAQTPTNKVFNCANNTCTVRIGSDVTGFGTGIGAALGVNVGSAGAPVLFNGAGGTPSSITLTNASGYPSATNAAKGVMEGDGSTISCVAGVCSSVGSAATAVTLLSTTATGGTAGDLASITSTGCSSTTPCLTQVPNGALGQALVSSGGTSQPTFKSGAWVLLNTMTASNSATLSDTTSITSAYTEYEIVAENILPATSGITLQFRFQVGGTFQSTSYLSANVFGNTTTSASEALTTGVLFGHGSSVSNTGSGQFGRYLLSNPANSAGCQWIHGDYIFSNGTNAINGTSGGCYNSSGAITGIQLIASSGNITSGVMKIYGRVN